MDICSGLLSIRLMLTSFEISVSKVVACSISILLFDASLWGILRVTKRFSRICFAFLNLSVAEIITKMTATPNAAASLIRPQA